MGKTERSKWAGAHELTRAVSEFQLRTDTRTEKRIRNTGKKYSLLNFPFAFLQPRDCKPSIDLLPRQITTYETNNTRLPQQYRRWLRSTGGQLRQQADHHAKQREHARGIRI